MTVLRSNLPLLSINAGGTPTHESGRKNKPAATSSWPPELCTNSKYIHKSMPSISSTRAQTQHPRRQPECKCKCKCDRDGYIARFLLIYCTISLTTQVRTVNSHRDMDTRHGRRLRCVIASLHLMGRENSGYGLPSLERYSRCPLPLYLQTLVH